MATILIVEDDRRSAEAIASACESAGHTVGFAVNGVEALRTIGGPVSYDLWLVEIGMPKMDGLSLTRTVRTNAAYHDLPIIAVTGRASQADLAAMEQAGFSQVLTKPLDALALQAAIALWLSA